MIRKNPSGDLPVIDESAYVDKTAIICGKVIIQANVFVGPYAVIRADEVDADGGMQPIVIGANSNIQDGVVIHSKSGAAVTIGEHSSIAHRSIVHGPCEVGDRVFIGFNSVLFNCRVGDGCVVRHNAVVDGCDLPAGFYVPSTERIGPRTDLASMPRVSVSASEFSGRRGAHQRRPGTRLQVAAERVLNMRSLLIRNARMVNEGQVREGDLLVRHGRIERIAGCLENCGASREIDAAGRYLLPGMIDDQVHFREPGYPQKGSIASESRAAVAGGITSFMDMPNTRPATLSLEALAEKEAPRRRP